MADPFISRDDLSDALGRDVTTDDGALIAVDAACDIVRDLSGQTFNRGTSTEVFDGSGTDALLLSQLPANTVGTVEVRDTVGSWTTAGTSDWVLDNKGVLYAVNAAGTSLFGVEWPAGRQNVRVAYDHGYADADLPRSVRAIALAVAERLFIQGPSMFETIGDVTTRYAGESTAVMPTERMILRLYKR